MQVGRRTDVKSAERGENTMANTIKREDAVQLLVDVIEQAEENNDIIIVDRPMGWESIRDYAEEVVSDIPSAENKGEWKFISIDLSECSECGCYGKDEFRYCPNCGARMKGADNEAL